MRFPPDAVLKYGESIGYMINVLNKIYKAILIESVDGEYFIISASYKKEEISVYRKVGRWTHSKQFKTRELCDEWWSYYQKRLETATTQIYI